MIWYGQFDVRQVEMEGWSEELEQYGSTSSATMLIQSWNTCFTPDLAAERLLIVPLLISAQWISLKRICYWCMWTYRGERKDVRPLARFG